MYSRGGQVTQNYISKRELQVTYKTNETRIIMKCNASKLLKIYKLISIRTTL